MDEIVSDGKLQYKVLDQEGIEILPGFALAALPPANPLLASGFRFRSSEARSNARHAPLTWVSLWWQVYGFPRLIASDA